MTTDPHGVQPALAPALGELAERYLAQGPSCVLCRDNVGTMPFLYISDASEADRVRGAIFAACLFCSLQEGFETRISQALKMARAQRQGVWN